MAFVHGDEEARRRSRRALAFARGEDGPKRRLPRHGLGAPARAAAGPCPEIDCVRAGVAPGVLAAAERRALAIGVGADEVLIAAGHIEEETHLRALAASLGVAFEPLDDDKQKSCPLKPESLLQVERSGFFPLVERGEQVWVMAPRGLAARKLIAFLRERPEQRTRLRITTPERLRRFVERHAAQAATFRAAAAFRSEAPTLSAASEDARLRWALSAVVAAIVAMWWVIPAAFYAWAEAAMTALFLAWAVLRVGLMIASPRQKRARPEIFDRDLPVYTVVAALYQEAKTLPELIAGLRALDYPPEKLDIKIVLEADDADTRRVAEGLDLQRPFEILLAPKGEPRTKPKALNAALPFARGALTVVFDAEDVPEPDQLRRTAALFRDADAALGCIQARLRIRNGHDNWLTRTFAAEYASLFDVLLPALAARRLPIPLGGSSNHFRTDVLRRVGAWDPHNVTEDADLGTRLARLGYRIETIQSATSEEALPTVGRWVKQRTRWFKGWLQTWLVHMRRPVRLAKELGVAGFLTFQLMLVGTVFAALIQPLAAWLLIARALSDAPFWPEGDAFSALLVGAHIAALLGGYAVSAALAVMGLARRRLLRHAWALFGIPLMWALLSVAAWRAVLQLLWDPYRWEKTEHGLARTSRMRQHAVTPIRRAGAARSAPRAWGS